VRFDPTFGRAARSPRGVAGIIVGLAGVGLAISAAFVGPVATATGAVAAVPASAVPRLQAIAERAAAADGDGAPQWITVVLTTHGKALESATPGDTEPRSNGLAVYLITMKGRFTASGWSGPSGSRAPAGTYLSLVVDARSFTVTDVGVSPRAPLVSPASLGPVRYLRR
jgi:hypothetical protein